MQSLRPSQLDIIAINFPDTVASFLLHFGHQYDQPSGIWSQQVVSSSAPPLFPAPAHFRPFAGWEVVNNPYRAFLFYPFHPTIWQTSHHTRQSHRDHYRSPVLTSTVRFLPRLSRVLTSATIVRVRHLVFEVTSGACTHLRAYPHHLQQQCELVENELFPNFHVTRPRSSRCDSSSLRFRRTIAPPIPPPSPWRLYLVISAS